ncbi:hypothetical protein IKD57_02400 [Candidatus Saccharibacteria bacterium]|nr:hypothetical protein [Candidatus Saccharibacteria bacterium]
MITKLVFILSYLVFFAGLTIFKKTDQKLNIVRYLIFQIMLTMIFNVVLMTILYLFGVGMAPMFASSVLGIVGVVLTIIALKKKQFQKYEFRWIDLVASLLIAGVAFAVGIKLFGPDLHLAYNNADPAVHFFMTQDALINGNHSSMFFNEINNALAINGMSIFTDSSFLNYKLYIIIEICMLAFSGLMFYTLVSQWAKKNTHNLICAVIAIFYLLGYSLNNTIYGFGYLGVAVTLICFTIILCKSLWDGIIGLKKFMPLMSMCAFCNAMCYVLFAPLVWLIIAAIVFCYGRKNKFKFKKILLVETAIFALPLILVIKFYYFDFLLTEQMDVENQIRTNGAHYAYYIKNAILFLPMAIYALIQNIRKKKSFVTTFFFISWMIFFVLSVIAREFGMISPYYCSKMYHVAWLVTFIMSADGTVQLLQRIPKTVIAYGVVVSALIASAFFNRGGPLVDIYRFNFSWVRLHETIGDQTMEGYRFASDEIVNKGEKIVWATNLRRYDRAYWFYGLQVIETNKCDYCGAWNYDATGLENNMKENKVNYIGIFKLDPESYAPYTSLLKDKKPIFENNEVAIYKY